MATKYFTEAGLSFEIIEFAANMAKLSEVTKDTPQEEIDELIKPSSQNKIKISFLINGVFGILRNYIMQRTMQKSVQRQSFFMQAVFQRMGSQLLRLKPSKEWRMLLGPGLVSLQEWEQKYKK